MKWKEILRKVAPIIAGTIGGPFGAAAAKFVADKLLGNPDATEEELAQFIEGASPEQLAQLRIIDNDFKVEMKRLGFKESELAYKDRQGARALFKIDKRPQIILSGLFIVGYFTIVGLMLTGSLTIEGPMKDTMILLLGVLTREVPTIMQFWFGSSSGSKDKSGTK